MMTPKSTELKLGRAIRAWTDLAPDKSFAGMTLDQFKTKVAPSMTVRDSLKTAVSQRMDAQTQRDAHDEGSLAALQLVVNSIKGEPTEGEDSALYQAFGYVRKSDRKSGLTRKAKTAQPAPANPAQP